MEVASPHRRALLATGLTLAFMLLVAMGVSDQGWVFSVVTLLIASLALGGLHLIFPHGLMFALGAANGLAIYVSLFVVIGQASFPAAAAWSRGENADAEDHTFNRSGRPRGCPRLRQPCSCPGRLRQPGSTRRRLL